MKKKVNIYCTTYHRFNKTIDCIQSLIFSAELSSQDVHIYIVDNNSPQEMKNWLTSKRSPQVTVMLLKNNIGKGAAVNIVHSGARESDYIISIDGDMINSKELNWIDMLADILEIDEKIGLVSCDFSAHATSSLKQRKYIGDYTVKCGSLAIGGGCFMMRANEWDITGGYTNKDIYIEDDALLMRDIQDKLKKIPVVCEQAILHHPPSDTKEEKAFQEWKNKKARGIISKDKTENTGFYENQ